MTMVVVITVMLMAGVMVMKTMMTTTTMMLGRSFLHISASCELAIVMSRFYVWLCPYCKHPRKASYDGSKHRICRNAPDMASRRFTFLGQL